MIVDISPKLTANGLSRLDLFALRADAATYNCLFFQPLEAIVYGNEFMRAADQDRLIIKFNRFFDLAHARKSALVLAPEYSCPTASLTYILGNGHLPGKHDFWIIGGQSIKAEELNQLQQDNQHVNWIIDQELVDANLNKPEFFNPIYHIFCAQHIQSGELQMVVVVQFKTHHLGGKALLWERENMIKGREVYLFKNSKAAVRLVTINCADIFNPNLKLEDVLPDYNALAYLIIHLQLNTAPNNPDYCSYRSESFNKGNANTEFICLNWAKNITMGGTPGWNAYGGSGIYVKLESGKSVDTDDPMMINNELKGMYYTRWHDRRADIYFLNYDEYVFEINKEATMQHDAVAAVRKKRGPKMENTFSWNAETNQWEMTGQVDPGFSGSCSTFHQIGDYNRIKKACKTNPIDVERLVCLSAGIAVDKNWHRPPLNPFFQVDDRELPSRVTFTQNTNPDNTNEKLNHLRKYGKLEYKIITNPDFIPEAISDLKNNCRISYREKGFEEQFHFNLYPKDGNTVPATGCYLGETESSKARNTYDKIAEKIAQDSTTSRVVVWWLDEEQQIASHSSGSKPKITDANTTTFRDINKGNES